jgi:hypothetical protein
MPSNQIEPSSEAGDTVNITFNFLYCNHQLHRDFLIILYICIVFILPFLLPPSFPCHSLLA